MSESDGDSVPESPPGFLTLWVGYSFVLGCIAGLIALAFTLGGSVVGWLVAVALMLGFAAMAAQSSSAGDG